MTGFGSDSYSGGGGYSGGTAYNPPGGYQGIGNSGTSNSGSTYKGISSGSGGESLKSGAGVYG